MIEQLSKTKAWAGFVEWAEEQFSEKVEAVEATGGTIIRKVSDRELLSLLVEFCDSKGYYIQIKVYYDRDSLAGMYYDIDQVHIDRYIIRDEKGSITRTEATQRAVVKCFELMANN